MLAAKHYRPFGRTGLRVSPICLGTDNFANPTAETESIQILHCAIENGINLIDTANSYAAGESERIIGKALQESGTREDIILATKFYYPTGNKGINDRGTSRKHIIRACEDSLRRLQTDYIDLYQLHRIDMEMPLEEVLAAMTDLVQQGKIRYFGATTSPSWKIAESKLLSEFRNYRYAVSEQLPYNLLDRRAENEILPACAWADLAVLAWSPLAMGMLTGKYDNQKRESFDTPRYRRGGIYAERITNRAVAAGQRFAQLAREAGYVPAHLAMLWVMGQPGVNAPLCGPRTLDQLKDLIPLMEQSISPEMQAACDEIVPPGSAVANFLNTAPWMKGKLL
ncbi:aldo/keto reductase [Flavilitoribacter nigricans]|uniref:Aldo/keto reductase n=1 Tax=Flavilitoribacter nigricans (strain ATCC 23147 / DSM 23189 / NBRC 102662 / NCIMB 1420 / SS-2) TaxID=1122177 RepID=A0A2D0NC26_FLAN2|nr:aldo/keto reductase [Flavilitoribacter nigricans]PHN05729.1 aldo/keto reductase [Flavilitoribacter nigricans DSM 23189 = NBRC 102662]